MKGKLSFLFILTTIAAVHLCFSQETRSSVEQLNPRELEEPLFDTAAWQDAEHIHLHSLVIPKRKRHYFRSRDSVLVLRIDTLIMKDRAALRFFGKKQIRLEVGYAEIGNKVFINGMAHANNASHFDIKIGFAKLGSFYVMANGMDAMNGTRTDPNGDGGNVHLRYDTRYGITPQSSDRRKPNYLYVDVSGGGRHVNPTGDLSRIYQQIIQSGAGLRGLPQGQIYSGVEGKEGISIIEKL